MKKIIIDVDGMMCKHCKAHVEEACKKVCGVNEAVASLDAKNVTVTCNDNVTKEALIDAINNAGYSAK